MMTFDWIALALGAAAGAVTAALFFAGLALGMRLALRASRPTATLLASSTLRIAGLLAAGWLVAGQGGAAALAGFALAFLVVRTLAIALARRPVPQGAPRCN
jgi:hypothetical protein